MSADVGVSFVIPVHNGERWLPLVLRSVLEQADGRPFEVLAIEDGSTDGSARLLDTYAAMGTIRVLRGEGRGAAAALNLGIAAASHPIVCQVDQDVVLQRGWMTRLLAALEEPNVAAAQGYYVTSSGASIWARVMGLDLATRYDATERRRLDHVCTGNTAYRRDALVEVGGFDQSLGYGYDNDLSYRLVHRGYRLVIEEAARSVHCWRDDFWGYLVQQYGFGYGRLDLVAKHRSRVTGDAVSRLSMMLHAPVMALALVSLTAAAVAGVMAQPMAPFVWCALGLIAALAAERWWVGVRAWLRFDNRAGLWFAPVHLLRDAAWVAAMIVWASRRLRGVNTRPAFSMLGRPASVPGERR